MNCSDVEELAGAFALGAVPTPESSQIAEHLASCPQAHRLVSELLQVAGILPLIVDEVAPPARLRGNIMAAALAEAPYGDAVAPTILRPGLRSEAGAAVSTPASANVPAGEEITSSSVPTPMRPRRRWLSPALLAAAALFVTAVGLGAWNVSLNRRLDQRSSSVENKAVLAALASGAHVVLLSSSTGVQGQLVEPQNGGVAYLVGTLPAPSPGKAYQAWLMRDGVPVSAGVFKSSGFTIQPLQGSLNGVQLVAFTLEPEQGSKTPTLPVVAQAPVS